MLPAPRKATPPFEAVPSTLLSAAGRMLTRLPPSAAVDPLATVNTFDTEASPPNVTVGLGDGATPMLRLVSVNPPSGVNAYAPEPSKARLPAGANWVSVPACANDPKSVSVKPVASAMAVPSSASPSAERLSSMLSTPPEVTTSVP